MSPASITPVFSLSRIKLTLPVLKRASHCFVTCEVITKLTMGTQVREPGRGMERFARTFEDILSDVSYLGPLGEGMYGRADRVLYKDRPACLKIAWPEAIKLCQEDGQNLLEDFRREAETLLVFEGTGLAPRLYGFGVDHPVIVMEYIEGVTLHQFAHTEMGHNKSVIYAILIQLAQQLDHIHGLNYAHSDAHDRNIIVCQKGTGYQVRLIDFGNAQKIRLDVDDPSELDGPLRFTDPASLVKFKYQCDLEHVLTHVTALTGDVQQKHIMDCVNWALDTHHGHTPMQRLAGLLAHLAAKH